MLLEFQTGSIMGILLLSYIVYWLRIGASLHTGTNRRLRACRKKKKSMSSPSPPLVEWRGSDLWMSSISEHNTLFRACLAFINHLAFFSQELSLRKSCTVHVRGLGTNQDITTRTGGIFMNWRITRSGVMVLCVLCLLILTFDLMFLVSYVWNGMGSY